MAGIPSWAKTAFAGLVFVVSVAFVTASAADAPAAANEQAVRQHAEQVVKAFNAGQAQQIAELFLPDGETIDEQGNQYKGREEIVQVFSRFFEKFPQAQLAVTIDSLRFYGENLVIEDGTRTVTTKDGATAVSGYTAVLVQRDGRWFTARIGESAADPVPTPHDRLQPLAWMVGEWVDEGADALLLVNCRWTEDQNFLLVDYTVQREGRTALTTSQRIGWDPLNLKIRSWMFDSDGGYGGGDWTPVANGWVIKSTAVLPDGTTGSATLTLEPVNQDKFLMKGRDRIVGDESQEDYELQVVRRPPQPKN